MFQASPPVFCGAFRADETPLAAPPASPSGQFTAKAENSMGGSFALFCLGEFDPAASYFHHAVAFS